MAEEAEITSRDLAHAFEAALKTIHDKPIVTFVQEEHLTSGGMRPNNVAFMRTLILNHYRDKLTSPPEKLMLFLRTHVSTIRFITLLAHDILLKHRAELTVFFGKADFLLALLMDVREKVRSDAAAWMRESGGALPEADAAQKTIRHLFAPLISTSQEGDAESAKRLRERVHELEEQQAALKRDLLSEKKAAEKAKAQAERDAKAALANKDFAIQEYKSRLEAAEAALNREREKRDALVAESVIRRQAEVFGGWLKPLCAVEDLLQKSDTSKDLLARAAEALAAQRKFDQAAANQARLKEQLLATEKMLEEVTQTLDTAQLKAPQLVTIEAELRKQRDTFRAQLFPEETLFSEVAKALAERIDTCSDVDVCAVRDVVQSCERAQAISTREANALRKRLHRHLMLLDAALPALNFEEIDPDTATGSEQIQRRNPALATAVLGQSELLLFLDGHNILNGIGRYRQRRGRPQTHEEARNRLETDMRRMFCNLPRVAVNLVWDGMEKTQHNLSENILVHYSGGTGEHRADRYIIGLMDFYKQQTSMPMVLVTDDNGFAGEAQKRGAQVCRLHDFEAFLDVPLA